MGKSEKTLYRNKKESKSKTSSHKSCCNPFKSHNNWILKNLRLVTNIIAEKASKLDVKLTIGSFVCVACFQKIQINVSSILQSPSHGSFENDLSSPEMPLSQQSGSSGSEFDVSSIVEHLNAALKGSGIPEIEMSNLRYTTYATQKRDEIMRFLSKNVFNVDLSSESREMIDQLKAKFETASSRDERTKILSILPQSWSATTVAEEFKVPIYMAKATKKLVKENGILCGVKKKLGSTKLNDSTVEKVHEFYREDEISRNCPGLRDYVTVTEAGKGTSIQRRLILMNLKEAYEKFKNDDKYKDLKIGFSKFAELRPPECVLALDNYGTHCVCVCQYHQNFKLLFNALKKIGIYPDYKSFRDLLTQALCREPSDECYFGICSQCIDRISSIGNVLHYDLEEERLLEKVTMKQWIRISGKIINKKVVMKQPDVC